MGVGTVATNLTKQKGMAMLTALLLVALATSLASSLWYGTAADLARVRFLQHNYQAKHMMYGLLLWASDVLEQDYENDDTPSDGADDGWLQGIQNMPVEGAVLSGRLKGMSHCFNVNNLWQQGQVSDIHYQYFLRLLQLMKLDVAIADQILDWLDADQLPRPKGAEDVVYLGRQPSYQTAGGPFMHVNQLQLLDAITPSIFDALKPYVCVLPVTGLSTKMNVNTMPPLLLRALDQRITVPLANSLYQDGRAHYNSLDAFFQTSDMAIITNSQGIKEQFATLLSVQTRYIEAQASVSIENSLHVNYALLRRTDRGASVVIQRSQSPFSAAER